MEWGVSPIDLIRGEGIEYEEYNLSNQTLLTKITKGLRDITKKIKAIFVVKERIVLTDTALHSAKKPFAQGHELGHHGIPEHKEILYVCSEEDLDPRTRAEMEFEANVFASEILLPTPLMEKFYEKYPICMETVLLLKQLSNASFHTCAIRYVSQCNRECCLLVLTPEKDSEDNLGLRLESQIWSPGWKSKYRKKIIGDKQFFPSSHNLSQVAFSGVPEVIVKNSVRIKGIEIPFQAETFFNQYKVFALLFT